MSEKGYFCGTPKRFCGGTAPKVSAMVRKQMDDDYRVHSTPEEAFKCYTRYLIKELGYERIGPREFRREGEPVLVLTKKTRFGRVFRKGKRREQLGKRWVPDKELGGFVIG